MSLIMLSTKKLTYQCWTLPKSLKGTITEAIAVLSSKPDWDAQILEDFGLMKI